MQESGNHREGFVIYDAAVLWFAVVSAILVLVEMTAHGIIGCDKHC